MLHGIALAGIVTVPDRRVRFRRRVKYREQHLEDPHTDNEQDGER